MGFKTVLPYELKENVFDFIKKGCPLLSSECDGKLNTMTVNWGQMGYLWNKCVTTVYVRPQRYTFPIIDSSDTYSLCFMGDGYTKQVAYCGKVSGRDEDKIANCGFTIAYRDGVPYFEEAELVLICRKCYSSWLDESGFVDKSIVENCYSQKDFHKMFIGEITEMLVRED